ncbi:MAG: sulfatase, partial [Pedosphaera sp.]|nr:sulfatase [Pedosphaera sp.]
MKSPFCTGFESTVGMSRRGFLNSFGMGLGGIALGSLLRPGALLGSATGRGVMGSPHFAPKAKRVIYLFQSGGP